MILIIKFPALVILGVCVYLSYCSRYSIQCCNRSVLSICKVNSGTLRNSGVLGIACGNEENNAFQARGTFYLFLKQFRFGNEKNIYFCQMQTYIDIQLLAVHRMFVIT